MTFTVIGFDTEAFTDIYETVDGVKSSTEALESVREIWGDEACKIIAVFKGEPDNLYNPDDDPINSLDSDYEEDDDDDDE